MSVRLRTALEAAQARRRDALRRLEDPEQRLAWQDELVRDQEALDRETTVLESTSRSLEQKLHEVQRELEVDEDWLNSRPLRPEAWLAFPVLLLFAGLMDGLVLGLVQVLGDAGRCFLASLVVAEAFAWTRARARRAFGVSELEEESARRERVRGPQPHSPAA